MPFHNSGTHGPKHGPPTSEPFDIAEQTAGGAWTAQIDSSIHIIDHGVILDTGIICLIRRSKIRCNWSNASEYCPLATAAEPRASCNIANKKLAARGKAIRSISAVHASNSAVSPRIAAILALTIVPGGYPMHFEVSSASRAASSAAPKAPFQSPTSTWAHACANKVRARSPSRPCSRNETLELARKPAPSRMRR